MRIETVMSKLSGYWSACQSCDYKCVRFRNSDRRGVYACAHAIITGAITALQSQLTLGLSEEFGVCRSMSKLKRTNPGWDTLHAYKDACASAFWRLCP